MFVSRKVLALGGLLGLFYLGAVALVTLLTPVPERVSMKVSVSALTPMTTDEAYAFRKRVE